MALSLIIDPPADLRLQEEIFGPLLPLVSYDQLDDAVARIHTADRPLSVYVFGDEDSATALLAKISCGGAAINACAIQGALPHWVSGHRRERDGPSSWHRRFSIILQSAWGRRAKN